MNGFVLAGTASGVGKTVASLAAIRALSEAGHAVQPAKAGPDFIDPSHHAAVAGRASRTLDPWLCGEEGMARNYYRGEGDICVVEGMMGLYDGETSTARITDLLGLPVVLVCDASASMESVAASALGFQEYASHAGHDIDVAGIVAGRAHGGRHERGIREALPDSLSYFGRVPPLDDLEIPERHLGLHMGGEAPIDLSVLDEAAAHLDSEALAEVARAPPRSDPVEPSPATGKRVAVARDSAFCFRYPATIERLQERGEVVPFSPVRGDALPDCDGVYLPGGYPELHAPALAESQTLETLAARAGDGLPILGECGGLMALAESLTTVEAETYRMAGVLPARIEMRERYQALDHVELRAREDTLSARAGESLRGHEFHYSSAEVDSDARFVFDVERGAGLDGEHDGLCEHRTLGTYTHVHAESGAFDRFFEAL